MCCCLKEDDDVDLVVDDDDDVVALTVAIVVILFHLMCSSILLTIVIYLYYPLYLLPLFHSGCYKGDTCENPHFLEIYRTEKWTDSSIFPSMLAMLVFHQKSRPAFFVRNRKQVDQRSLR